MRFNAAYLYWGLWIAFLIYWQAMAYNVKATKRLEPAWSRYLRVVLLGVAIALLSWTSIPLAWMHLPIVPNGMWRLYVGLGVTFAGLLFAVWARVHLGKNWSRSVTVKQDHELITSGPYALVRHPIYTGILFGLLGSVASMGELRGLLAFAIFFLVFLMKLRMEEQWMREQFGETYAAYSKKVAALVPFIL